MQGERKRPGGGASGGGNANASAGRGGPAEGALAASGAMMVGRGDEGRSRAATGCAAAAAMAGPRLSASTEPFAAGMTWRAGVTAAAGGSTGAVVAGEAAGGAAGIWGPKSTSYVATRGSELLPLGGSAWGSVNGQGAEAAGATVAAEGGSAVLRRVPADAATGLDADGAEAAVTGLAGAVLDGGGVPGADGAGAVVAGAAVDVVLAGVGAGDCSGKAGEVLVGASAGEAWPQWAAVRGWGIQHS